VNDVEKCACCHKTEFKRLYADSEGETIRRCCACGLICGGSVQQEKAADSYYGEDYYKEWTKETESRKGMWAKRLNELGEFCPKGSLLDVGCGLGDFAGMARDEGWDVAATEISSYAAGDVSKKRGIEVKCGEVTDIDFGQQRFDAVTMWHVLEHMPDPLKALKKIHGLLKEEGLLVIEVPNVYYLVLMIKSWFRTKNLYSALTLSNNPEPHYVHFSVQSLKKLLRKTGFDTVKICVGIYGEHQRGFLRRLKSRIYNIMTVLVYILCGKNIGVNTRIYARKKKARISMAMVSLDVRRDLDKPLDNFERIDIKHYYKKMPYNDMAPADLTDARLVKYKNGLDLFFKILKQKPDIIQGIEPYTFPAGLSEYLAITGLNLLYRIPFFFPMLENRPVGKKFGAVLAPLLKLYLWFYAKRALFVIPLNQGAEKNLLEAGVSKDKFRKIIWGCWGVDPEEFCPEPAPPSDNGRKTIFFAGRLHYSKGISYLLEAFDRLRKEYPLKLVIAGSGEEKENIIEFCNTTGLIDHVVLTGSVNNAQMPDYFRAAYVTVTPSITVKRWEEQVGMINIQSMACGTPVVSTRSGAIPEFVEDGKTGLLVEEKDAQGLYEAVKKLLDDKDLYSKLSIAARQYCLERFCDKTNIAKAEDFVRESL